MKNVLVVISVVCLLASGAFASIVDGVITGDAAGNFNEVGPVESFATWATTNFQTQGSMDTWLDGSTWRTGASTTQTGQELFINFQFEEEIETCRIDFSSEVHGYGSNDGLVKLRISVDGGITFTDIYKHWSPDYSSPEYYNYSGPTPFEGDRFETYTDLTDLVAGETSFILAIYTCTGWSGFMYNGGHFLTGDAGEGDDFVISGTMVPEPATICLIGMGFLGVIRRKVSRL